MLFHSIRTSALTRNRFARAATRENLRRHIAFRILWRYTQWVIKSFRHRGIERFFRTGSKAGIQAKHAKRLGLQLAQLNKAVAPADMGLPGWNLHPLKHDLSGHWAVTVQANWRLTFRFEGPDAVLVDYQDYH